MGLSPADPAKYRETPNRETFQADSQRTSADRQDGRIMSMIVICPGCCADMIAGKDNGDRPSWHCPICGFTDAPLVREMQLWKDAYDRGFQR